MFFVRQFLEQFMVYNPSRKPAVMTNDRVVCTLCGMCAARHTAMWHNAEINAQSVGLYRSTQDLIVVISTL